MLNSQTGLTVISRFLLARLAMDEILAATSTRQGRRTLDRMTNGLGIQDAYNTTLGRIRQQDQSKSRLGMAVLMWVSRCERPLQSEELRHALGVDLGAEGFTIDNVPSVRTVLGCTLGLVTIDENTSTVRLLHLTLQEHLGVSPTIFETPQSLMAEICLTYLDSPSVQRPRPNLHKALEESPFLEYATRFWGTHAAREVTEQVKSRALRLLDGYENHVSVAIFWRERIRESYSEWDVHGISGLHCIAFWGIVEIAIAMLEKKKWDVNGRDSKGDTPLMWAVRYSNDRVVEELLKQGDIRSNMAIRHGRTVFSFAAEAGNEGAAKLLLERGSVSPDLSDNNGRTPLSFAASGGHEGVVKLLLERSDANSNSPDRSGRTPLSYAVLGEYEDVTKLLLDHNNVHPDSWDYNRRTHAPLPALGGLEGVGNLVPECSRVDTNSPVPSGRSPVSSYASLGYRGAIHPPLGLSGANLNSSGDYRPTLLPYATRMGRWSEVRFWSEDRSADCDWWGNCDRMPTSITDKITSYQEVTNPPLAGGNLSSRSADGSPLSNPKKSVWAMVRNMGRQSRQSGRGFGKPGWIRWKLWGAANAGRYPDNRQAKS